MSHSKVGGDDIKSPRKFMLIDREIMRRKLDSKLNANAIKMEKELAQSMLQNLSEKMKLINEHGMIGVITTMSSTLPLIRCEEGAPELADAVDNFSEAMMRRIREDRSLIFEDDTYRNRERFFKGIPETRRFLDEATDYFGEEYTHVLRYSLGFEA